MKTYTGLAIVMLYLLLGSFAFFTWASFSALLAGLWIFPAVWLFLFPLYAGLVYYFTTLLFAED